MPTNIPEGIPPCSQQISYDLEDLNHKLLEIDAQKYLNVLNYLSSKYPREVIRTILNHGIYETYYSNHSLSLAMLVGNLNDRNNSNINLFYGDSNQEGISENLAINILDKMVQIGVDLWAQNTYGENIINIVTNHSITYRTNNERFREKLRHYYNRT